MFSAVKDKHCTEEDSVVCEKKDEKNSVHDQASLSGTCDFDRRGGVNTVAGIQNVMYEEPVASLLGVVVEESDGGEDGDSCEAIGEVKDVTERTEDYDVSTKKGEQREEAVNMSGPQPGYKRCFLCAHVLNNADCIVCNSMKKRE